LSVRVAIAAGLVLALQAPAAFACGYCVEDKIAAVYDHAVVAHALGRKHHIVFFHLDGTLPPGERTRRALEAIAESTAGVDKGSARASVESASLAVAFDPRRTPLADVLQALERKLAPKQLSLLPLRVIDRPADMKAVTR
jgi:hypothetical protein